MYTKKQQVYTALQIIFLVILCFTYAISLTVDYLGPSIIALIQNKTNASILVRPPAISKKYHVEANIIGWGHETVWRLAYILLGICIIFICISSCLPVRYNILWRRPTLLSIWFLLSFNLNFIANILWVIFTNYETLWPMVVSALVITYSLYATLAFSYKSVHDDLTQLEASSKILLWGVRILVQNVIALYATWLSIIWPLNLSLSLSFIGSFHTLVAIPRGGLLLSESSTLALVIILIQVMAWFTIENFIIERYCRYTFTVYPTVIFSMSAIIANVVGVGGINLVLAAIVKGIAIIQFLIRIALVVWRVRRDWKRKNTMKKETLKPDEITTE